MPCWFYRFMISQAADSDKTLGRITERHVARCEDCRQFCEKCQQLSQGLQSEAANLPPIVACTAEQIIARLGTRPRPTLAAPRYLKMAIAACIAVVAVAAAFLLARTIRGPEQSTRPVVVTYPAGAYPAVAWPGLLESPLSSEIERIVDDTESGVRFLVACLDVSPLENIASRQPGPPSASSTR